MFKVNAPIQPWKVVTLLVLILEFWTIVAKRKASDNPEAFDCDDKKIDYFLMNFVLTALPCDSTCNRYMPWLYLEQSML